MKKLDTIWLASYPRSGNTFLRTILWQCFALRSASIYKNDLGGNKTLEDYTGHIEHGPQMQEQLHKSGLSLIKTHGSPQDSKPAIYVVRDGRAACVSLWKFYNEKIPLKDVIEGRHMFGTWCDHVQSWQPWMRPNTLLLKYEELRDNLPATLKKISLFLERETLKESIPQRETIAGSDGRWVKVKTNWKSELYGINLKRFMQINKAMLKKTNYL